MSVAAMTFVFKTSEAQQLERLVMLCHADHAHGAEPPWQSYAGILLVAHETRATRKGVQDATRRLVEKGRLKDTGQRRGGAVVYELVVEAQADALDRVKREEREERERTRNRKGSTGAKELRPCVEDDTGEGATPPTGEGASPARAVADAAGAEVEAAGAASATPEPVGTRTNQTAAKAAAAGEPAQPSSSSTSSTPDAAARFWGEAASMLVAAGFDIVDVEEAEHRLKVVLRKHADRLPQIAWDVLALQLREGREERTIAMWRSVVGTLSFGLSQPVGDHLVDQPTPPSASRGGGQVAAAPLPELKPAPLSSPPARTWEAIRRSTQRRIGDDSWNSWLATLIAIESTEDPPTLWLAAPANARAWIEDRLLPLLSEQAQEVSGDHTAEVRLSVGEVPAVYRQDAA